MTESAQGFITEGMKQACEMERFETAKRRQAADAGTRDCEFSDAWNSLLDEDGTKVLTDCGEVAQRRAGKEAKQNLRASTSVGSVSRVTCGHGARCRFILDVAATSHVMGPLPVTWTQPSREIFLFRLNPR